MILAYDWANLTFAFWNHWIWDSFNSKSFSVKDSVHWSNWCRCSKMFVNQYLDYWLWLVDFEDLEGRIYCFDFWARFEWFMIHQIVMDWDWRRLILNINFNLVKDGRLEVRGQLLLLETWIDVVNWLQLLAWMGMNCLEVWASISIELVRGS